jgi:hypothetical protein
LEAGRRLDDRNLRRKILMQSELRVYVISALIAAVVAAATAFTAVRLLGPSASQSQSQPHVESPSTMVLEGVAEVPRGEEAVVHYKTSFGAPPYLTFPEGLANDLQVAEQKADSFTLRATPGQFVPVRKVKWKAEGQSAK